VVSLDFGAGDVQPPVDHSGGIASSRPEAVTRTLMPNPVGSLTAAAGNNEEQRQAPRLTIDEAWSARADLGTFDHAGSRPHAIVVASRPPPRLDDGPQPPRR